MSRVTIDKKIIYVSGLPRAGGSLLCQLLGHHPEIYSTRQWSPLAQSLDGLRNSISQNSGLRSQMDRDFELVYQRIGNVLRSAINGWFAETDQPWVVDWSHNWIRLVETISQLDDNFRMLVCVREPGQIFASLEAQHQASILLDSSEGMTRFTRHGRAMNQFGNDGEIGKLLEAMKTLKLVVPEPLRNRVRYIKYEELCRNPLSEMLDICNFLGMDRFAFDPDKLNTEHGITESLFQYKKSHPQQPRINQPVLRTIPERIQNELAKKHQWFYRAFYPEWMQQGNQDSEES